MDTRARLRLLISLAKADGELSEKERNYIISIGLANHLMVAEILPLFVPTEEPLPDVKGNKEETLLQLIQLMRIDEKIYAQEMRYCATVAARLGFREEAVFELLLNIKEMGDMDKAALVKRLEEFKKSVR